MMILNIQIKAIRTAAFNVDIEYSSKLTEVEIFPHHAFH